MQKPRQPQTRRRWPASRASGPPPAARAGWRNVPKALPFAGGRGRPAPSQGRFGATFPHDPQATKHPNDAVFAMPLGNDLELDVAEAAIDGEQLGADQVPDLLVVSLSAHDYVGHGWGHESEEQWDLELRLDRRIASFLDALDTKVGAGKWAMIVTSDHGASPLPETVHGGRLTPDEVASGANAAASAVLGAGHWIDNAHYPNVYLSAAFFAQPQRERKSAIQRIENALRSFPSIERVGVVADVAGHCDTRHGDDRALCLTFDRERSGDLYYLPARGYIMDSPDAPEATAHGSLHDYDRQVPLLILPPGRTKHAPATAPVPEMLDMRTVAPLLAKWLGTTL